MPRPRKCRRVGFIPQNSCFNPQVHTREEVVLSIEEVEAIRLSDYFDMEQDKAAESMNVSRGTFQRIINSARSKTADALIHGKTIRIEGGNYELSPGKACCKRHKGTSKAKELYYMNDNRISKLENPIRMEELSPRETLIKAGFEDGMTLCDIGAGTGIFSFPAAEISGKDIYALEVSDNMIELLGERMVQRNVKNLKIKKVESSEFPLDNDSCDFAVMVTVLHEIENKEFMINEIKRILRDKGKLLIIEFHKGKTPMGPPVDHRISLESVEKIGNGSGLKTKDKFSLGDNYYGIIFES